MSEILVYFVCFMCLYLVDVNFNPIIYSSRSALIAMDTRFEVIIPCYQRSVDLSAITGFQNPLDGANCPFQLLLVTGDLVFD